MRRLFVAVVALLTLSHMGSAAAEDNKAYRYYRTTQLAQIQWYSYEPVFTSVWLSIQTDDSPPAESYGWLDLSYSDEAGWGWVSCSFPSELLVVSDHGEQLESAELNLDSTQEGVSCSDEVQVHIALTPTPGTGTDGQLHSNGTETIDGHVRVIQTQRRYWGVAAQGYVGGFDLPPDFRGQLEVEDWQMMTK
jgi:hypothetical protein